MLGLAYMILLYLLSSTLNANFGFSLCVLYMLIGGIIGGAVGGILGVNL